MSLLFREIRPTLALAVPIIISQLSQMLIGITDSVMIGHVGTVALAASSFGGNVFGVFYILGIGLIAPVAIFVAHARGAGRPGEAGEYLRHGLVLALGFGVVETLILGGLAARLEWFGQPSEVLAEANPFFLLIGGSITPVLIYLVLRQFAEAMGRPWAPVLIMLGSAVLNVGLNWILIYGHWGVPALGLTGAGIATIVTRVAGAWGIYEWIRRDPRLREALPRRWLAPLSRERFREMTKIGIPAAGMLLFESGAFAAAAVMMGWLGAEPLAAHQIALTCASTTFMFALGLATAAGMRISAAVGANEFARLRPIGGAALGLGAAVAGWFMVFLILGGEWVASWFVRDPVVVVLAAKLLVVAGLFQFVDGSQVIGASLLRGLKDVKVPAAITFVAYWVIALGSGYVLGLKTTLGAVGIWVGLAAGLAFAAAFLGLRFYVKSGTRA